MRGVLNAYQRISIHAAREGGDLINDCCARTIRISIHAAREGGDVVRRPLPANKLISIHAAREGGDKSPEL